MTPGRVQPGIGSGRSAAPVAITTRGGAERASVVETDVPSRLAAPDLPPTQDLDASKVSLSHEVVGMVCTDDPTVGSAVQLAAQPATRAGTFIYEHDGRGGVPGSRGRRRKTGRTTSDDDEVEAHCCAASVSTHMPDSTGRKQARTSGSELTLTRHSKQCPIPQ